MQIVAVLNQKGGVGKSTLAVNLAAAGHLSGRRTLVLDLDRQGSAIDWAAARPQNSKLEGLSVAQWAKTLPVARFRELSTGYDLVVLDGPPRLGEVVRSAAVIADIIAVPVTPGGFDMWALSETLDLLAEADAIRTELGRPLARRVFVVNRASNTLLSRADPETLAAAGDVCPVLLHTRVAFAASVTSGESVFTTEPGGAAAHEVQSLYEYLTQAPS